ncbi:MAG: hypothetical protein SFU99_03690 [Saprospiraceae bacterium]|nr:hypothetical protein [Saprospiraceae bacterium]
MKIKHLKLQAMFFVFLSAFVFITGCDKDDDNGPGNEQELITSIILTFAPTGGGIPIVVSAKDLDGDGGNPPVIQNIELKANTDYALSVSFLDESKSPVENITEEVEEENVEHLVCLVGSGAMPSPVIQDKDDNGKLLGLVSILKTGAAGNGTLKVSLKHEPDKNAANACSTGETDAEQTFNVAVK